LLGDVETPDAMAQVRTLATFSVRIRSLCSKTCRCCTTFDFNRRGIKPAGGKKNGESKIDNWQGSTLRRVLISPRIAGLREHNGEVVGKAVWPAIIDMLLMIVWSGC
jgi:hypothetical protein